MERREDVLKQELNRNANERERWTTYKEDNVAAMNNLDMFSKKLSVEVMVPICKKALMPGELIHTNELLVSHYQGYFSACSAHKAKEICQHRLQLADETLKKLQVEADLWQNKLTTPVLEGAVPSAGEVEIVEEYSEDEHKTWLKKHKERLRKEKELERKERDANVNDTDTDDTLKKLEERELMEELSLDPDDLDNNELLEFLNEARSEVNPLHGKDCGIESNPAMSVEQLFDMLNRLEAQEQNEVIEIDPESELNIKSTQEMVRNLMNDRSEVKDSRKRVRVEKSNVERPSDMDIETSDEEDENEDKENEEEIGDMKDISDDNNIEILEEYIEDDKEFFDICSKYVIEENLHLKSLDYDPIITDKQLFKMQDKMEAQEQNELIEINPESEQNLKDTQEMVRNLMKDHSEVKDSRQRVRIAKSNDVESSDEETKEEEISDMEDMMYNDDNDEEDQPEQVKLIRDQMSLLPKEERIEFLNTQLDIIIAKMRKAQRECFISDELTNLLNVVVYLEDDLQEMLFEQEYNELSAEEPSDDAESLTEQIHKQKRRISFAETDEQLVFKKNEPVDKMLPKAKQHKREVIQLDDASLQPVRQEASQKETAIVGSSSPLIMQKVEKNLEFVKDNQSVQDFDLVNQILEAVTGRISTLKINSSHSDATAAADDFDKSSIPSNPSHFYSLYKKALAKEQGDNLFPIYTNSFEGEEELKVPILNEKERDTAYVDPRAEFSKPAINSAETKSILRNKSAETHPPASNNFNKKGRNRNKKKQRTIDDELRDMSAYQKVMHDLVETTEPTEPEPLPQGKYIDANAPKKRISRFKEQRAMSKT